MIRVFREVNERGLLRDEQFGFDPDTTSLQLSRLIKGVNRNPDERRPAGAGFLGVARDFNTGWVGGLIYRLTVLSFPSYW
jgi:hypothetical protein